MAKEEKKSVNPMKYFLSGGFGGICTVLSGHPFDTIKVRLQTMPKPAPGESPLYAGALDCAKKTVKTEGVTGLYKGMGAPIAAVAPIFAISFFGYGLGKRLQMKTPHDELNAVQLALAGAFSGFFTTTVMAPGERIKCLLQIQRGGSAPPKYAGPIDAAKQILKEGGVRSLYRGTCATLLRDVPGSGVYFLTYEVTQKSLTNLSGGSSNAGMLASIFAGGMAGLAMWIVCMPPDVLKSRLQTAPEGTYKKGIRSVFVQLMKEEGATALYRGIIPVMMRAFPANAACFFGFELCQNMLNKVSPD